MLNTLSALRRSASSGLTHDENTTTPDFKGINHE